MGRSIVFATGNQNKMREIRMILADLKLPICSMGEAGINLEIEENGKSFEENATIKAFAVYEELMRLVEEQPEQYAPYAQAIVLADDSGLEIDYLQKAPGIYSARYLGEETPYTIKNNALLAQLTDVPDEKRRARFVCAVAAVFSPDNAAKGGPTNPLIVQETMEGRIAHAPAGENGFGYDPIFYLPEYGCTSAQLAPEQKNTCSHRGKALRAMRAALAKQFGGKTA